MDFFVSPPSLFALSNNPFEIEINVNEWNCARAHINEINSDTNSEQNEWMCCDVIVFMAECVVIQTSCFFSSSFRFVLRKILDNGRLAALSCTVPNIWNKSRAPTVYVCVCTASTNEPTNKYSNHEINIFFFLVFLFFCFLLSDETVERDNRSVGRFNRWKSLIHDDKSLLCFDSAWIVILKWVLRWVIDDIHSTCCSIFILPSPLFSSLSLSLTSSSPIFRFYSNL